MNEEIVCKSPLFDCMQREDVAVFDLKKNAFTLLVDLNAKKQFFDVLSSVEHSPSIKGVVVLNTDEYRGERAFNDFLLHVMGKGRESEESLGFKTSRFLQATHQLTLEAVRFTKPMVAGLQGHITGEFLGTVMPFDFRYAAEDVEIEFPNVALGFPPSAPLTFYLLRNLGEARATEILMNSRALSAIEAHELGLLTAIVEKEALLDRCLEQISLLSMKSGPALVATRRLLKGDERQVKDYLDWSYHETWSALIRAGKVNLTL